MQDANKVKFFQILINVFKLTNINEISEIKSIEDNLQWDSLNILQLIALCEKDFSITIDIEDYEKFISIESIENILKKHNL
tara:strand:- start:1126 stop:1368 length:243 start_codon:yes stop_codon:yes gene_type:complete